MTGLSDFNIETILGFNINKASLMVRKRLTTQLKEAGHELTPEEFSLLSRLWEENAISQSDLIEKTIKDKTRVTRLLNSLIKKNYVYKRMSEGDRRNQIVYLTDQGKEIQKIVIPVVLELMNQAGSGISKEELEITQNVLQKVFRNLN